MDGIWLKVQRSVSSMNECPLIQKRKNTAMSSLHSFFFILKGEALMVLDDEEIVLKPGEGVEIKPFQYHQMKNVSEYEVEFLVYSTPPAKGDRKYKNEL